MPQISLPEPMKSQVEYKMARTKFTWHQAHKACVSWGGTLAKIMNVEEQARITNMAKGKTAWIGLHD
jgi:hypothetical protein